jgi:hypothetical protein
MSYFVLPKNYALCINTNIDFATDIILYKFMEINFRPYSFMSVLLAEKYIYFVLIWGRGMQTKIISNLACRHVARQRQQNKQIYNRRC